MKHEYLIEINNNYEVNVDTVSDGNLIINFIKEINLYSSNKRF